MGHHTWADIVPFVMHSAFVYSGAGDVLSEVKQKLTTPEEWAYGEFAATDEEYEKIAANPRKIAEANGWRCAIFTDSPDYDATDIGNKGRLYGFIWKKANFVVHLVNESEFSNAGEYEIAVCGNDKASVEAFKSDFGFPTEIEESDSVTQSG